MESMFIQIYQEIYKSQYFSYNGADSAEKFVEKIMQLYKNLTYKMFINEKKKETKA